MTPKFNITVPKWRGLFVVILAALLIEGISGVQYLLTRQYMEGQLEKRAESELTLKAILIKSNLNDAQDLLHNCMWKVEAHIDQPDSAFITMDRFVKLNSHLTGAAVGFVPYYYYPEKGRLFEVYARRLPSGEVVTSQIASESHDYTKYDFYEKAISSDGGSWVGPYYDKDGAHALVTSYFLPMRDRAGRKAGFAGVDVDVKWLSDTINNRHIYPSSFILVLTESNDLVIHPDTTLISNDMQQHIYSLITDSTVARHKSNSGRSTVVNFDSKERAGTVFYAKMRGTPHWTIAVVCYDDEVYAPLAHLRLWLLVLMLAAFAVLLYVVWRFARQEKTVKNTNRLLEEKVEEQKRIDAELSIANGIQQALLPEAEPTLKDVGEVGVVGRLIPAKAVGGDLYNVFIRNGKLFFCIGDVSGKGVPAALIMAVTQTLFFNIGSRENDPARIMEHMNQTACRKNPSNIFVTLFIGVLDLPTGRLHYCNAGHEVPYLMAGDKLTKLDCTPNIPIGLFDDFKFQMQTVTMQPGSTIFLYTDGLTEARNASRDFFGLGHIEALLGQCADATPEEIVDKVVAEVGQFAGETEQSDDLTLLAVRFTPSENVLTLDEQITLSNDVKEVARLGTFFKDVTARLGIGKPLAPKLRLAVEEAVVNVMEYAYPAGQRGDVTVRATFDGSRLKFVITDTGIAFNPTEAAGADTTLSAEERPVGGLGILLTRELMDFINYERIDGRNTLTLMKRI
ncbi:MAG: SpoIIE family protein phosphatase [Prevotella sp.]|nr:SpoIIE family protein phosphatase [Prevotella sp.]